jgi:hypothetical protein
VAFSIYKDKYIQMLAIFGDGSELVAVFEWWKLEIRPILIWDIPVKINILSQIDFLFLHQCPQDHIQALTAPEGFYACMVSQTRSDFYKTVTY